MNFTDRETVWVLGWPRSGNTWLCRLLGDLLDSPISSGLEFPSNADEGFNRSGRYVIRMRHPRQLNGEMPEGRLAQIVRDPRDVLVSTKRYWKSRGWTEALHRMEGWQAACNEWLPRSPAVRYEDLLANPALWLGILCGELNLPEALEADVNAAIKRQSWAVRKAEAATAVTPYGSSHEVRALGRGLTGTWQADLPRGAGEEAHAMFWPLLRELEYEEDVEWFTKLPVQV